MKCERQSDEIEQGRRAIALIAPALQASEHLERPRQRDTPSRRRGFSDDCGSWKIIWMRARNGRNLGLAEMADFDAVELDAAGGRLQQPHQQPAQRRLARAGLADQTEHRAAGHREIDMLDDLAERRPPKQRRRALRIGEAQAAGSEQNVGHDAAPRRAAGRSDALRPTGFRSVPAAPDAASSAGRSARGVAASSARV